MPQIFTANDEFHVMPVYSNQAELLFSELLRSFPPHSTQNVISEAEEDGSIFNIDFKSLELASTSTVPISVNVSQRTIEEKTEQLQAQVAHVIKSVKASLTIEITETYKASPQKLKAFADFVRARGGHLALDDVGEGVFSSYTEIRDAIEAVQPRWLKLHIGAPEPLIRLCQDTGIPVIFEWIDSKQALDKAFELGATGAQGTFFNSLFGIYWMQSVHQQNKRKRLQERGHREIELIPAA